jgi:secreted PhoX family phosphatase
MAIGGTSSLTVDSDGKRLGTYTSLAGTDNNCAGGITPWGTWLTCEETDRRKGATIGGRTLQKDHGYVFEVDPTSRAANLDRSPVPLPFLGRYSHEAVAVDPDTHQIYLTEDAVTPNGLYYRWTPPDGFVGGIGALHELARTVGADAGRLQAMSCSKGRRRIVDLSEATEVGTRYRVRWVDVPDRVATTTSTRLQAYAEPITRSRKLEGQWWGNGGVYFVASFARPEAAGDGSLNAHDGQVWFYAPQDGTITLKTLFAPNPQTPEQPGTWDGPDNITVSPHGGLIVAEDGDGKNHLIGIGRRGDPYALARNEHGEDGEFCGPAFSADGRILFTNIQSPTYGVTLAITGPWRRGR